MVSCLTSIDPIIVSVAVFEIFSVSVEALRGISAENRRFHLIQNFR